MRGNEELESNYTFLIELTELDNLAKLDFRRFEQHLTSIRNDVFEMVITRVVLKYKAANVVVHEHNLKIEGSVIVLCTHLIN